MDESITKIEHGDLYALLETCTAQDLAPLVTAILKAPKNSLVVNDDYVRFKPDHTRYHQTIGDEIRTFGTAKNLFKQSERASYHQVIADVCDKLDVPFERGETVKNEANLLNIFMQQRWSALSLQERQQAAQKASDEALKQISTAANLKKAGAALMLPSLGVLGTVKGASLLLEASGAFEATFEVTIPCVLHIAYLRRKVLEEWRNQARQQAAVVPSSSPWTSISPAIAITGDDGAELLSIAPISKPTAERWHKIGDGDDGISRLSPLLQVVPALLTQQEVGRASYMLVVTNGDKLMKANDVMKGVTVGANGKISGIANLFSPDKLASLVNVSALISIASIALAQKHLADISEKLSEIKEGIDAIQRHQENERLTAITGSIEYLEQVAPSVLGGDLSHSILQIIELSERELLQIQKHLMKDIQTALSTIENMTDDEWFGSADTKKAIEENQVKLSELYRALILCLRARAYGWQLLCAFPVSDTLKEARRLHIQQALDTLDGSGEMLARTDEFLRQKIHQLSSAWNKATTINERKLALLDANENLLAYVAEHHGTVSKDFAAAEEMMAAVKGPISLAVCIENDRVTAVQAL